MPLSPLTLDKRRTTAFLVLVALLPLVIFASATAWLALRWQSQVTQEAALNQVRFAIEAADRVVEGNLASLRILAESNTLNGPTPNLATFHQLSERYVRALESWDYVVLTDLAGQQVINSEVPFGAPLPREPDTASFQAVVVERKEIVGSSVSDGPSGKKRVGLSMPIIRDGEVRYMLTAALTLERLERFVASAQPGARAYVADTAGTIIIAPKLPEILGSKLRSGGLEARQLQPQGSYESSAPSGESTIVFFARSSLTGWSSHVAIPRSVYDAPFLRYRAFLIAAGLLALFVTGCFVWLLKRENDARLVLIAEREHERRLEALGRVASSVAHDFNNLLTAVQGSLALLRRGQRDTDRGDRMIEIAKMAVERGANLTSQLLSFSRKDQFEAQPVDLNEEFGVVANLLANMLGDRVSLTWRVDEGASGVMADRAKLTATLLNLCTNARDAMPDGGEIELTASGREGAADGSSMVVIRVRDSGLGMSPDVLRRAIEPFFSTKGNRGTGLGLATAVSFARQSGGDLAIDSAPGRGTTVELTLPHAILEHGTTVGPLVGRSAPLRILAVDDDPLVLVSTVSILEEAGHFVRSARSAEMAITVLSEHHFDLVITDVRMPGIGGAGLVRAIRGEHSQVAVLVFSGYPDAFDAREAGVPFLRKPATADEIRDAIDLALRSHETQWEARRDA